AARIRSEQSLEEERIAKEKALQAAEILRRQALDLAEQQRSIAVARESKNQSEAQAAADIARATAVAAEEKVFTAREVEAAERRKAIELIGAAQAAEREALQLTSAAQAEKLASADRGEAIRLHAEADAQAEKIRALAMRVRTEAEAEGVRLMNEAQNVLSADARASALRLRVVDKAEGIIRESVKPMERIEGIKILQVDGLLGGGNGVGPIATQPSNFADGVVNSALRFRAQAPIVDQLLKEIGIHGGDMNGLVGGAMGLPNGAAAAGALPPAAAIPPIPVQDPGKKA